MAVRGTVLALAGVAMSNDTEALLFLVLAAIALYLGIA